MKPAPIGLGKMAFGGLGANAVNTALVGWAMLYVSWPALMDPNSMQLDANFIDPLVRLKKNISEPERSATST